MSRDTSSRHLVDVHTGKLRADPRLMAMLAGVAIPPAKVRQTIADLVDAIPPAKVRQATVALVDCIRATQRSLPEGPAAVGTESTTRPAAPTREYCLIPPNLLRWNGAPEKLEPRLYKLMDYLLCCESGVVARGAPGQPVVCQITDIVRLLWEDDAEQDVPTCPVPHEYVDHPKRPKGRLERKKCGWADDEDYSGSDGGAESVSGKLRKRVANVLSALNTRLTLARFPWRYGVKAGHVHRE
jgi:hypothetical protein